MALLEKQLQVRLLLMFIPPLGLGFAAATWAVSVFLLGGKNIIEAKFSFIHQHLG